jgi:hypothetical protein
MSIRLNIDICDNTRISGWAIDNNNPNDRIVLDLLVDDRFHATIFARNERADLIRSNIGDGKHAFQYHFSQLIQRKTKAKIALVISATRELIYSQEVVFSQTEI